MEFPRLGVESELQLLAYATAMAMPDSSCICSLYHTLWQYITLCNHILHFDIICNTLQSYSAFCDNILHSAIIYHNKPTSAIKSSRSLQNVASWHARHQRGRAFLRFTQLSGKFHFESFCLQAETKFLKL